MQNSSSFQVYNASAGSGKTFTLVKEYLKILLLSEDIFLFQKILAITFTNKAAGEMKERVLNNLQTFADRKENDILPLILDETNLDKEIIEKRSKKIVDAILQNYAGFSITTIDSFTHKIIKSFAFDLGLSLNFEVEMDAVSLLSEAVDVLVSKIGSDNDITKLLIHFSLSKTDDDKSWDISKELNDISKILLNEDDAKHINLLASKELSDFNGLQNRLSKSKTDLLQEIKNKGIKALDIIENAGLEAKNFTRGTFPKFLKDLSEFSSSFDFKKRSETIDKAIENHNFYTKTAKPEIQNSIEGVLPELISLFEKSKEIYGQLILCELALKSLIPLAVLNNINTELNTIKEDNNIRLNAEFNQLIANNIKNQPTPFIYERIGQRFMHYFIDEMQDTSTLQWKNLIPLIDNALAQENSNLLLVGDGKQAIYRWRGGKAEQFISLGSNDENSLNPFQIPKVSETLETNFRSYDEIINFNNDFFQHSANFLQNTSYKQLFIEGNKQSANKRVGGCVSITFLEKQNEKETEVLKYPIKVLEKINELQTQFRLDEICILVRKKSDGIAVANYLSENSVPIVSSETLLLKSNTKINFIVDVLQILQHPTDKETLINVLYFLHGHLNIKDKKHLFISKHIHLTNHNLFESLASYSTSFNLIDFNLLPFYEKIENIIRGFHLSTSSDAYIQFFLDVVLEQQRNDTDIQSFLDYWDRKKDNLSIVAPESTNAVQIMTIHKSKGLEFPVVIFPCDLDIYQQINPKIWLNKLPENYTPFNELLLPFNKSLNFISNRGKEIYEQQREELELDNLNLLYVALTRPIEQLHIITDKRISKTGENTNYYSGIFINYLKKNGLWNDTDLVYLFGNDTRKSEIKILENKTKTQDNFISSPWQDHNIYMLASASKLWNTKQEEAIEYGNLIHEMMSKIITAKDIPHVITEYTNQGIIQKKDTHFIKETISNIVKHPLLKEFFAEDVTVFSEREIVTIDNQIIIPDRLIIKNNIATIIDYKTGKASTQHHQQVLKYANALKEMNLEVHKKLLVYIGEEILVEKV
ncbi:ATP-dependent exoDNAse (exonuclease V) beta subunit (contains helicase and exonuclease domains) [Tenacibaculum sp. MAR_2009_124]|uniref:UvrD-helicase domain-containing protein n=1 Tax=Tenacibaculum sp. MAR_2009_124 TaxID=1250059 RepID=UPI000899D27C|nr:UvrD-helicase domain-containing protein [Tenacibaculum sp. MAR_2009_124]SEB96197.1 ATP-dependent exoDNAse (exonuclease V) beta subunit (contains helicase and exonuclease domains) [Tenacibaculum sp. MAR_2009_124]